MGFFSGCSSRKQQIEELCKTWTSGEENEIVNRAISHTLRGNTLWVLHERSNINTGESEKWIGCYLLAKDGPKEEGYWGYRPMDESDGPYHYTCPLSYLVAAKEINPEWRAHVRKYHAKFQVKLKFGDLVELNKNSAGIEQAVISSVKPLRIGGYRCSRRMIKRVIRSKPDDFTGFYLDATSGRQIRVLGRYKDAKYPDYWEFEYSEDPGKTYPVSWMTLMKGELLPDGTQTNVAA
jgi:hypothetical protein